MRIILLALLTACGAEPSTESAAPLATPIPSALATTLPSAAPTTASPTPSPLTTIPPSATPTPPEPTPTPKYSDDYVRNVIGLIRPGDHLQDLMPETRAVFLELGVCTAANTTLPSRPYSCVISKFCAEAVTHWCYYFSLDLALHLSGPDPSAYRVTTTYRSDDQHDPAVSEFLPP